MTARLPTPGADNGNWGTILNDFLEVSLKPDGTLNNNVVDTNQIQNNAITNAQLDTPTQTNLSLASSSVQSVNSQTPNGSGAVSLSASDVGALTEATADGRYAPTGAYVPIPLLDGTNIQFVSTSSNASDDNDGLSLGMAKATVAGALATLPLDPVYGLFPCGTIYLGYGNHTISAPVTNIGPFVSLLGPGKPLCTLIFTGSGACLTCHNTEYPSSGSFDSVKVWPGRISGFTIDGSAAVAGSVGLEYGDNEGGILDDLMIQNFTGAGSIGLWVVNKTWWTEKVHAHVMTRNCTSHVVFDVAGADTSTASHMYCDYYFETFCETNQNAVVLQNGTYMGSGRLTVRGNFWLASSVQSSACLTITGTTPAGHPSPGLSSKVIDTELDIKVETDESGSYGPQTIKFGTIGSAGNSIQNCNGFLSFSGTWTASNWNQATDFNQNQTFTFTGVVIGDYHVSQNGQFFGPVTLGGTILSRGYISSAGAVNLLSGDLFTLVLSQNVTISFGGNVSGGPQRKKIRIKQVASGGPYTVTWPRGPGSVASPIVYFPGGNIPTMSTVANAFDVYDLYTEDGGSWWCTYSQAMA